MHKLYAGIFAGFFLILISCENNRVTIKPEDIPADSLTISYVTEQIRLEPKNSGLFSLRARLFFESNQFEDALKDALIAYQLDSMKSEYYLQLSDYYIANGQSENAKNILQKLTVNLPDYVAGYVAMAKMYLYVKDYKSAEKWLAQAENKDPQFAQTYFVRGVIAQETGQKDKAIKHFQESIERDPNLYESYNFLGILFAEKHDTIAAQYYQTAARLNPDVVEPLYNEGMFWQEEGKYDKSIAIYKRIISEKDSNYPYAYFNQAYILLNYQNKSIEAIPLFEKALSKKPGYVEAVYNLGLCYEDLSRYKEARDYYKKALELQANYQLSIDALNRLDKFNK
jgi:tetratricopeptide (TPR) repeat protein